MHLDVVQIQVLGLLIVTKGNASKVTGTGGMALGVELALLTAAPVALRELVIVMQESAIDAIHMTKEIAHPVDHFALPAMQQVLANVTRATQHILPRKISRARDAWRTAGHASLPPTKGVPLA